MRSEQEALEIRRKRLLFQSHHRGTKESDLFLGAFAGEYLPKFSADQIASYEKLLDESDNTLFDWIFGRVSPPTECMSDVLTLLLAFKYRPEDSR